MMMREAASCGYVVRVAGHASSCAHIVSHPLSAACRLVSSSRRAYLRKVEAARGQGNSSTNPSRHHRWADPQASYRAVATSFACGQIVSPLSVAVRAVSCRACSKYSWRARAYLV